MKDDLALEYIQKKLLLSLDKLNVENPDLKKEIMLSNAITKVTNTYLNTCNLKLKLESKKINDKK